MVNVHSLIESYDGPAIFMDFYENGRAIGIEILYPSELDSDKSEQSRTDVVL